jgi:hypothetical protein
MNVCSGNTNRNWHEEIVFEEKNCPMCRIIEIKDDFEKDLQIAQERIKELEALLALPHTT